jgi:large subunit ribosomal protein L35
MPKMKSKRGAAKRFSRTGSGQFKCAHSHHRHILTKKSAKRKRQLRGTTMMAAVDMPAVRRMLPYG